MPRNRDILWKSLLEWLFDDLLRFLYPDTDEVVDLTQPPVFMDKELAAIVPGSEDEMTTRVVDKLVRVRLKNNSFALVFAWAILIAKLALLRGKDREKRRFEGKLSLLQKLYDKDLLEDRKSQAVLLFMEQYL